MKKIILIIVLLLIAVPVALSFSEYEDVRCKMVWPSTTGYHYSCEENNCGEGCGCGLVYPADFEINPEAKPSCGYSGTNCPVTETGGGCTCKLNQETTITWEEPKCLTVLKENPSWLYKKDLCKMENIEGKPMCIFDTSKIPPKASPQCIVTNTETKGWTCSAPEGADYSCKWIADESGGAFVCQIVLKHSLEYKQTIFTADYEAGSSLTIYPAKEISTFSLFNFIPAFAAMNSFSSPSCPEGIAFAFNKLTGEIIASAPLGKLTCTAQLFIGQNINAGWGIAEQLPSPDTLQASANSIDNAEVLESEGGERTDVENPY